MSAHQSQSLEPRTSATYELRCLKKQSRNSVLNVACRSRPVCRVFYWTAHDDVIGAILKCLLNIDGPLLIIDIRDRTIRGKISKGGNKYLRTLFVQAAHVVLVRRPSAAMRGLWPWIHRRLAFSCQSLRRAWRRGPFPADQAPRRV
jgi:Transposase IS116/IS110/IS902 family